VEKSDKKLSAAIIDLLIHIPIFDKLDPEELKLLVKYMNIVEVKPKEVIFKEGERGDYVCFVAEGILDVLKTTETGSHVVISSLPKGRSIGEMAVLDNFPRSATVRSRTQGTLLTLSREAFENILDEHPRVGIKVLQGITRLLSLNLRKTSSRLADYMLPVT